MRMVQPEIPLDGFLKTIWEHKREYVVNARGKVSLATLQQQFANVLPARNISQALRGGQPGSLKVIAEVKRASPSKGSLRPGIVAGELAKSYEHGGAAAVSVLTDETYFMGRLEDLREVKSRVSLPVLRKDFLIDPYQIAEAKAFGADACLLIAALLGPGRLTEMVQAAVEFGVQPLIELHEEKELEWVANALADSRPPSEDWIPVLGINARNLSTLKVDLDHVLRLGRSLPADAVKVAESGIKTSDDALRIARSGFDAILVGEALVKASDPGAEIHRLLEEL